MKIVNTILLLVMFSMTMFAQTVSGNFVPEINANATQLNVVVQIQLDAGESAVLSHAFNLKFDYDTTAIRFVDGTYLNFNEANNYITQTISRPGGSATIQNIETELTSGNGQEVTDVWIDFVLLNFEILDVNAVTSVCPHNNAWGFHFYSPELDGQDWAIGDWECDEFPLPVELTSFTAQNINNTVVLNWETATELNNYGFNVQRNGETIGFVPGYGNSNSPKSYSFTNVPTTSGTYSYRLQQIDNDGTTELSSEVFVDIVLNRFDLSQNYPNPFNPSTTIGFFLNKSEDVSLIVYDVIGSQVAVLAQGSYDEGYNEVIFNASNLSSGMYIYRLQTDSGVLTKTMILLK